MKSVFKIIFTVLGTIITLNGIGLFFVSNVNLGNFLAVLLGTVIIFVALAFQKISKWLKLLLVAGISLAMVCSSFLIIFGKSDSVTYKENAVIVLGAAVHGKTPSRTLRHRLDKTIEYHTKNPDAIIIVSGGRGSQEDITEAEAMKLYLIERGVADDKILKEEKATSTAENFSFSKAILDEHFDGEYTACFVTNEYHIFRSLLCADHAGIENATHAHSNTSTSYLLSGVLRECLATVKYTIFKN